MDSNIRAEPQPGSHHGRAPGQVPESPEHTPLASLEDRRLNYQQLVQLLPLLPLLTAIAASEHVSETAAHLGLPQSTVSRALARASAVVGVDLLVREGRGVRLTPAARVLVPYLESALSAVQEGLESVRQHSGVVRGRVRVTFQHTFGEATLPLLIGAFRRQYPQTEFDLRQGARNDCLTQLVRGEADLAFTAPVAAPSRSLASAVLYREPLCVVLNAGHRLAGSTAVTAVDISEDPFVAMGHGYGMRSLTDAIFRAAGLQPRVAFESQDTHTVRGLVSAGLGVSILPRAGHPNPGLAATARGTTTAAAPIALQCVEVPLDSPLAYREIGLAWRIGGTAAEPDPVRLFRQLVLQEGPDLLATWVQSRHEPSSLQNPG